jgi:hypothetical protein
MSSPDKEPMTPGASQVTALRPMNGDSSLDNVEEEVVCKEGILKKRSGRMSRWSTRYFILTTTKISYKIKESDAEFRACFDLVPGCICTETVEEQEKGMVKSKTLYSFWLVWPYDKTGDEEASLLDENGSPIAINDDSSVNNTLVASNVVPNNNSNAVVSSTDNADESSNATPGLRHVVKTQKNTISKERSLVSEQLERHEAHDKNMNMIPKVAAVALGGIVITALTAGIGLVPYIAGVGGLMIAGGAGAAISYNKPADSRLILAFSSPEEAAEWKAALENQISYIERMRSAQPPSILDMKVISGLVEVNKSDMSSREKLKWSKCSVLEGLRIFEHINTNEGYRCRKAAQVFKSTPLNVFLAVMEGQLWPRRGELEIVSVIDDHTDIIMVTLKTHSDVNHFTEPPSAYKDRDTYCRKMYMLRFWKLSEDGNYLITYSSISLADIATLMKSKNMAMDTDGTTVNNGSPKGKSGPNSSNYSVSSAGNGKFQNLRSASNDADGTDGEISDDETTKFDPFCRRRKGDVKLTDVDSGYFNAAVSISPRIDYMEYDNDLPFARTSISVRVPFSADTPHWLPSWLSFSSLSVSGDNTVAGRSTVTTNENNLEMIGMLNEFLFQLLVEVKDYLASRKFVNNTHKNNADGSTAGGHVVAYTPELGPIDVSRWKRKQWYSYNHRRLHSDDDSGTINSFETSTVGDDSRIGMNNKGSPTNWNGNMLQTLRFKESAGIASSQPGSLGESSVAGVMTPLRASQKQGKDDNDSLSHHSGTPQTYHNHIHSRRSRSSRYSRNRSSDINEHASKLRGQIAAKEYELQRLERVARRRSNANSQEAMVLVQHQYQELVELKVKYQELTGTDYEHVSSRNSPRGATGNTSGGQEKWGLNTRSLHVVNEVHAKSGMSSIDISRSGGQTSIVSNALVVGPIPSHWYPSHRERVELMGNKSLTRRSKETTVRLITIIMIIMLATLLLANVLSA